MDNRNSIINSTQALPFSSPCTASLSSSLLLLLLLSASPVSPLFSWHTAPPSSRSYCIDVAATVAQQCHQHHALSADTSRATGGQRRPHNSPSSALVVSLPCRSQQPQAPPLPSISMLPAHCPTTVTDRQPPHSSHHHPILSLTWLIYLCRKVKT